MKTKLIEEKVYSPVNDTEIKKDVFNSEIWKQAYKKEELTNDVTNKLGHIFEYTIKFDGLTPVQVTNVKLWK